ncbi:hypothetical protein ACFWY6_09985 [Streptomyces sp. NPDC059037]|uniref:hypothetical protein n=1 Tax=Streptomyces sp. NPDC059037 TaxID=3346710 RepID=UPI0036BD4E73
MALLSCFDKASRTPAQCARGTVSTGGWANPVTLGDADGGSSDEREGMPQPISGGIDRWERQEADIEEQGDEA